MKNLSLFFPITNKRHHFVLQPIVYLVILLGLISCSYPVKVEATSDNSEVSTGFTYALNFPENQVDTSLNYYRLMMTPGQEQEITITLSNPGTEAITVELQLNGAKTNGSGGIEWNNDTIDNDASLMFPFEDIVSGPASVDLAGGETKEVTFSIKMPETSFDGIITGGLRLMKAGQTDNVDETNGSQVINQYAYAISIVLQENDIELTPDMQYNSAYAGQSNYRNTIFVNLSNVVATFLNDLTIEAQISSAGSSEVLYEAKTTGMRMAPNSLIDFPISMNGDRMVPGTYTAHVLATSGDMRWEWTEEFEITEGEAQEFNERDVGLEQDTTINWGVVASLVGAFFGFVLLLFVIVRWVRRKKKKKDSIKKRKMNQKKKRSPK
ncbi:DUF916 and DUF3324 domain-containing protein [Enterococcus sp. LJL90]